jgi:protein involved in polysaccharide export with SLBB domain
MSILIGGTSPRAQDSGDFSRIFADQLLKFERGGAVGRFTPDDGMEGGQFDGGRRSIPGQGASDPQTRLELQRLAERQKPTALEKDFSARAGVELKQFGYDLFQMSPGTQAGIGGGAVQDDYILGIGDELVITFQGQVSKTGSTRIDREGRVVLRDLPPISAAGRTFRDFRRELEARTQMTLLGSDVFVSLGKIRLVSVLVVGEVERPGIHKLSALSSLLDAISLAGGIKKTGSLRRLQVVRGDDIFWLDLYELIFVGTLSRDLLIRDGDRIVVPIIGDTVAAAGWVKRPGIYELGEGAKASTLLDLIALGGGTVRPTGSRLLHISLQADGRQRVDERNNPGATRIAAGDILLVELSQDIQLGNVRTVGHVRVPNRRSLTSAPTLHALLADGSIIDTNPYLLFAAVETTDTHTRTRRLYPANLESVFSGQVDYRLHDQDVVLIFSAADIDFLRSVDVQSVLTQSNIGDRALPCLSLRLLERVVALGDFGKYVGATLYLDQAITDGKENLGEISPLELERLKLERRRTVLDERQAKLQETQARMDANPLKTDLLEKAFADHDKNLCPELFEEYPKALPFLLEHTVMLQGEIRAPGVYPITGGTALASIVSAAEGLSREANLSHVELTRYDRGGAGGISLINRQVRDLSQSGLAAVLLDPGDIVQIGRVFSDRDLGLVTMRGEFKRPGRYAIKRGERMSEIIARAGGLTPQAYPYGAVFTRESVKIREKLGFARTALALEGTLATALSSPDSGAISLGSASQAVSKLVDTLRSAEPVGRLVMESDPTVLQIRPDLDIVLEPGDHLTMPKRPSSVTVTGEVLSPGALQFLPGLKAGEYIEMAGGLGQASDDGRIFIVLPNGTAKPLSISYWNYDPVNIPPGSTVVVPRDATPFDFVSFAKNLTQILSQLAIGAASIAIISNN